MLADPLVIGGESLPRIKTGDASAVYRFYRANGLSMITVTIRHTKVGGKNGAREYDRANIEVRETVFATSTVTEYENLDYWVGQRIPGSTSVVNIDNLADWIIAGANAAIIRVLAGES
jgi:hypothetical protein